MSDSNALPQALPQGQPQAHPETPSEALSGATLSPRIQRSRFRRIWTGDQGLRAGWAILLFYVIGAGSIALASFVAHHYHHATKPTNPVTLHSMLIGELVLTSAGLIATFVMSRIDKRSMFDYGLRSSGRVVLALRGAFWGLTIMAYMMGALRMLGVVSIEESLAPSLAMIAMGAQWALGFFLVGFFEELAFRGFPFFRLMRSMHPMLAGLIVSLGFTVAHMHNDGESVIGLLTVFAAGAVLCLAVWRTRSLWWAIGFHAAWDWTQSFVFGVADSGAMVEGHWLTTHISGPAWLSGGAVGPEGSVLVFPALAIAAYVLMRVRIPRG